MKDLKEKENRISASEQKSTFPVSPPFQTFHQKMTLIFVKMPQRKSFFPGFLLFKNGSNDSGVTVCQTVAKSFFFFSKTFVQGCDSEMTRFFNIC